MPRLAVLITYHNEGSLLGGCLRSLACGTEWPDEIHIFDDASQDPPAIHVHQAGLPEAFGRLVRLHTGGTNIGPAKARNKLVELTACDYIHFHDADDTFLPPWAQRVRQVAVRTKSPWIVTEVESTDQNGVFCPRVIGLADLTQDSDVIRFNLRHAIMPAAATYFREVFIEAGGYSQDFWQSEDYELHLRLAVKGVKWECIFEPLAHLFVRSASRSQARGEVWRDRLRALELWAPHCGPAYRADFAESFAFAGSRCAEHGDWALARRAFRQSVAFGPARYADRSRTYQWIARWAGPAVAERLALVKRLRMALE